MLATLSFESEHYHRCPIDQPDSPSAVSYALEQAFRGAGIPRPSSDMDFSSIRVTEESGVIVVRWRRKYFDRIQYDSPSQRTDTIEMLIVRSCLTQGIPGIIPETIKFTIED